MIFINKDYNMDLNNIVLKLNPPIDQRITKYIDSLITYNNHTYLYGNGWLDKFFRNYTIGKLNRLLKNGGYNIIVF
jgi:hypothetical protein